MSASAAEGTGTFFGLHELRRQKAICKAFPTDLSITCGACDFGNPGRSTEHHTLGEVFNISFGEPVIVGIAIANAPLLAPVDQRLPRVRGNLPTSDMVEIVDRCGNVSGRHVDKFAEFHLTAVPAEKVRPPLIAECPVNIECRVLGIQEIGDHDLFLGEVLAEHVAEEASTATIGSWWTSCRLSVTCIRNTGLADESWAGTVFRGNS